MTYFSRLTDIVTCNLSRLLESASDPCRAIDDIIREMEEGLAGAKRSVGAARGAEDRIRAELNQHRDQIELWGTRARNEVAEHNEVAARQSLLRKRELLHLVEGLEQQQEAHRNTVNHLLTMQRALEARLSEALRKRCELHSGDLARLASGDSAPCSDEAHQHIELEMEALRREVHGTSASAS
jgi:phage shock protein A